MAEVPTPFLSICSDLISEFGQSVILIIHACDSVGMNYNVFSLLRYLPNDTALPSVYASHLLLWFYFGFCLLRAISSA